MVGGRIRLLDGLNGMEIRRERVNEGGNVNKNRGLCLLANCEGQEDGCWAGREEGREERREGREVQDRGEGAWMG
jgi:hypothetical protein